MIKIEKLPGNKIRQYSDKGVYIMNIKTKELFIDVVNQLPCKNQYIETEKKIDG
jgi:hypothetical protein